MKADYLRRWLIFFLAGLLALHLALAWSARDLVRKGYPDFTIFYSAGKIVRQGLGARLYDEPTQYRVQQEFASGVTIRQGPLPYNHPPFEALLFVPFTWVPYFPAYLLWNLASLLILLALRRLLRPHIPILQRTSAASWLLTLLAYFPVFFALLQGQDVVLLLLLFTLAFVSLKRNNEFAAGCWLGLGLFRFHLVLPFVVVLLLQKRKKAVLGFLLVAAGAGLLSIAVSGWQGTLAYPSYVWHAEQVMGLRRTVVPTGMPNLRGLLDTFLTPLTSKLFSDVVIGLVSLALLVFTARRWRTTNAATFDLGFSLCVMANVLAGYHAFPYDLSLLVLPIALVVNHVSEQDALPTWAGAALLAPVCLLFLSPLQMFLSMRTRSLFSLMALVVVAWLVAVAREISKYPPQAEIAA